MSGEDSPMNPRIRIVPLPDGRYGIVIDRAPALVDEARLQDLAAGRGELLLGGAAWALRFNHEIDIEGVPREPLAPRPEHEDDA